MIIVLTINDLKDKTDQYGEKVFIEEFIIESSIIEKANQIFYINGIKSQCLKNKNGTTDLSLEEIILQFVKGMTFNDVTEILNRTSHFLAINTLV